MKTIMNTIVKRKTSSVDAMFSKAKWMVTDEKNMETYRVEDSTIPDFFLKKYFHKIH